MPQDPISALLSLLSLSDTGARTEEDIFTGHPQETPHGRVFGGQVLSQAVVAAHRTVTDDRHIHSMHGYFLRPGEIGSPLTFAVDRIHDGRSFSARRTQVYQNGVPILSMIASFQSDDHGVSHQIDMPADLPQPEDLPSTAESLSGVDHPVARAWATSRPFDHRYVTSPLYLSVEGELIAHQSVWVKAISALPDDDIIHKAALAYVSDYSLLEPIMRRHGASWLTPGMKLASIDHAMWWHRPVRVDQWLLYVQDSPSSGGGRGLTFGKFYSRDGLLVASVAQEGMTRIPE